MGSRYLIAENFRKLQQHERGTCVTITGVLICMKRTRRTVMEIALIELKKGAQSPHGYYLKGLKPLQL